MTYTEILQQICSMRDERRIHRFRQTLFSPDEVYGVGITKLKKLAKNCPRNHELALQLWNAEIHEAKFMAILLEEKDKIEETQLDRQVKDIYTAHLADYYADYIVSKSPYLFSKANSWTHMGQHEMIRRTGYACVCALARNSKVLDNNYFEKHLTIIELEINFASTWVADGQHDALISIGSRNKTLNRKAIRIAERIGLVITSFLNGSRRKKDPLTTLLSERVQKKLNPAKFR